MVRLHVATFILALAALNGSLCNAVDASDADGIGSVTNATPAALRLRKQTSSVQSICDLYTDSPRANEICVSYCEAEGCAMVGQLLCNKLKALTDEEIPCEKGRERLLQASDLSPSAEPSASPSDSPSHGPSSAPSTSPSAAPSATPSAIPSAVPSSKPSASPSAAPSASTSNVPSETTSDQPSVGNQPSDEPSDEPSDDPSGEPSDEPSDDPSDEPSDEPSDDPSNEPSDEPSDNPSDEPSDEPSSPSVATGDEPSDEPSDNPSDEPSDEPSDDPSDEPSDEPSDDPSDEPSDEPSDDPSDEPSDEPSDDPSDEPSDEPSDDPSNEPSDEPSDNPSNEPSDEPSDGPSSVPSESPTTSPQPSSVPEDISIAVEGGSTYTGTVVERGGDATVTVDNVGMIDIDGEQVTFVPEGSTSEPVAIDLPEDVQPTPESAVIITEFILSQLSAAGDLARRRLASTGCELFPDTPCSNGCCEVQSQCYADYGCTALSWARTLCEPLLNSGGVGTISLGGVGDIDCTVALLTISGACSQCNNLAVACIARGCSGVEDPLTSETCYDSICNDYFECTEAGCGCQSPGAACAAADTCGNGICDPGETSTTCLVDCGFNTCPDNQDFDCDGTCINPQTNINNCGACGAACPSGATCVGGSCLLPPTDPPSRSPSTSCSAIDVALSASQFLVFVEGSSSAAESGAIGGSIISGEGEIITWSTTCAGSISPPEGSPTVDLVVPQGTEPEVCSIALTATNSCDESASATAMVCKLMEQWRAFVIDCGI